VARVGNLRVARYSHGPGALYPHFLVTQDAGAGRASSNLFFADASAHLIIEGNASSVLSELDGQ